MSMLTRIAVAVFCTGITVVFALTLLAEWLFPLPEMGLWLRAVTVAGITALTLAVVAAILGFWVWLWVKVIRAEDRR